MSRCFRKVELLHIITMLPLSISSAVAATTEQPIYSQGESYLSSFSGTVVEEGIIANVLTLEKEGRTDEAYKMLVKEVEAHPQSALLAFALGGVERISGRMQPALARFGAAMSLPGITAPMAIACLDTFAEASDHEKAYTYGVAMLERFPGDSAIADRALKAMERSGRHKEGMRLAAKLLEKHPDWSRILYRKARLLKSTGELDAALAIYESLLGKTPFEHDLCNELGCLEWEKGNLDNAEEFFKRGLAFKPSSSALLYNSALLTHADRKDAGASIPLYRRALAISPFFGDAYMGLVDALQETGETNELLRVCATAVQKLPWQPSFYFKKAITMSYLGNDAEAAEWLRKGEKLDFQHDNDRLSYAQCLISLKRYVEARSALDAVTDGIVLDSLQYSLRYFDALVQIGSDSELLERGKAWQKQFPEKICFYYAWSRGAYNLNRLDEALLCVEQFELHKPAPLGNSCGYTEFLLRALADLSLRARDGRAIRAALASLSGRLPENANIQYDCGRLLRAMGRNEDAIARYREAILLNALHASSYSEVGQLVDKLEDALPLFRKALSLEPESEYFLSNLGFCLVLARESAEAVETLLKAVKVNDKNPLHWYNLALAYTLAGDDAKAMEAYRKSSDLGYHGSANLKEQLELHFKSHYKK